MMPSWYGREKSVSAQYNQGGIGFNPQLDSRHSACSIQAKRDTSESSWHWRIRSRDWERNEKNTTCPILLSGDWRVTSADSGSTARDWSGPRIYALVPYYSVWSLPAIASAQVLWQQKLKAEKFYISLHINDHEFVRLVVIIDLYAYPYNTVVRRKTLPKIISISKLPAPQNTKGISLRTPRLPSSHCAPFLSFQTP